MRIEIDDYMANRHTITTNTPAIAGLWLAEQAGQLVNANAALGDCRLRVWPETQQEYEILRSTREWTMDSRAWELLFRKIESAAKNEEVEGDGPEEEQAGETRSGKGTASGSEDTGQSHRTRRWRR